MECLLRVFSVLDRIFSVNLYLFPFGLTIFLVKNIWFAFGQLRIDSKYILSLGYTELIFSLSDVTIE